MKKNIALIAFPGDYFYNFSLALRNKGFQVYWVCTTASMSNYYVEHLKVGKKFVLDLTAGFDVENYDLEQCRSVLNSLELSSNLRINDIILMDRILRKKSYELSIKFLYHVQERLTFFLKTNEVTLVNSGRDTAIQMISLLVCNKLEIGWVVPTRLRIPKGIYGFCQGYETTEFIQFREVNSEDRSWAEDFYNEFHSRRIQPEMKKSYYSSDVVSIFALQIKLFYQLTRDSIADFGNDFTRYKIGDIIKMFFRRRINGFIFRFLRVYKTPGTSPFVLYNLHTQPESSIDVQASYYSDQINFIRIIARSIPITHELYVKIHPSDVDGKSRSFYLEISKIPGVRLLHFSCDTRELIERADIVFALTGTVAYEAGILGRTVVTFANNFFNKLPTINYCDSPKKLPFLISNLIGAEKCDVREDIIDFLADMRSRCFLGEFNRNYGGMIENLTNDDLHVLGVAFDEVFKSMTKS